MSLERGNPNGNYTMTVDDLISILTEIDPRCPVAIGIQPEYPIGLTFHGVYMDDYETHPDQLPTVWLLAGHGHPEGQAYIDGNWWSSVFNDEG